MSKHFPSQQDEAKAIIISEIKTLIEQSKQEVAVAVNATMTQLYWNIGRRINQEILKEKRAEYGKQIVATLWRQLSWSPVFIFAAPEESLSTSREYKPNQQVISKLLSACRQKLRNLSRPLGNIRMYPLEELRDIESQTAQDFSLAPVLSGAEGVEMTDLFLWVSGQRTIPRFQNNRISKLLGPDFQKLFENRKNGRSMASRWSLHCRDNWIGLIYIHRYLHQRLCRK